MSDAAGQLMLRDAADGCVLMVRVHPGARRNGVRGVHDGALKVALTTPPTDGRANAALVAFLGERLDVGRAQVVLLTGATSRSKTLRIVGRTAAEVGEMLLSDLA